MNTLSHWNRDCLPNNFYYGHFLWILKDGKIYKRKSNGKIHSQVWGPDAWNISERGYYNPNFGLITSHVKVSLDIKRKLARKFKDAVFMRNGW